VTPTRCSSLVLVLAAVALAGCGGGGKSTKAAKQQAGVTTTTATTAPSAPPATTTAPSGAPRSTPPSPPATTGNGGSEPARTDAELVGRAGAVKPSSVNVAPFVSVRITLTSGDGRAYRLSGAGRVLTVNGAKRSAGATLPGLRTGGSYTLTGTSKVVITSSGEPGP
jgi:hypothetical protein